MSAGEGFERGTGNLLKIIADRSENRKKLAQQMSLLGIQNQNAIQLAGLKADLDLKKNLALKKQERDQLMEGLSALGMPTGNDPVEETPPVTTGMLNNVASSQIAPQTPTPTMGDLTAVANSPTPNAVRLSPNEQLYRPLIDKYADENGVPRELAYAVVKNESAWNPKAKSPVGAQGLMQLMPGTASGLGVKDAYDPEQNIAGGTKYLGQLLKQFNGDVTKAVAAYNAGPGAVQKYGGIPPYKETQNYVKNVTSVLSPDVLNGVPTVLKEAIAPSSPEAQAQAIKILTRDSYKKDAFQGVRAAALLGAKPEKVAELYAKAVSLEDFYKAQKAQLEVAKEQQQITQGEYTILNKKLDAEHKQVIAPYAATKEAAQINYYNQGQVIREKNLENNTKSTDANVASKNVNVAKNLQDNNLMINEKGKVVPKPKEKPKNYSGKDYWGV